VLRRLAGLPSHQGIGWKCDSHVRLFTFGCAAAYTALGDRVQLPVVLPENVLASPEAIGTVLVTTPSGQRIPLSRLASVETIEGPSTIKCEWYQRRITVSANVRGRDMVGFVEEAKRKIAERIQMPPGRYSRDSFSLVLSAVDCPAGLLWQRP